MSEASLTEFTMFGNEYELSTATYAMAASFSVKRGVGVTDTRLYGQLPFTAIFLVAASKGLTAGMLFS